MITAADSVYWPRVIAGVASGTLMLWLFGGVWLAWGFGTVQAHPLWIEVLLGVIGAALVLGCIKVYLAARELRRQSRPPTPAQQRHNRRTGRVFGIVFGAEIVVILVTVNILQNFGLQNYLASAIVVIVGIHFLPLAKVFVFRLYYLVAACMIVVGLISAALSYPLRDSVVTFSAGAILWLTCVALIRRGLQLAPDSNRRPQVA